MNNKLSLWTITVAQDNDYMYECETVEEMKKCLKNIKESGVDMYYVAVFPPNTGFLGEDFLIK